MNANIMLQKSLKKNTSMFRSLLVNWPLNRDLIMTVGLKSTKIFLKEDEYDDEDDQ